MAVIKVFVCFIIVWSEIKMVTASADCTSSVADVAFLIDTSGSICDDLHVTTCSHWETAKTFVNQIVDQLNIGPSHTRVAVSLFGNVDKTRVIFPLNRFNNKEQVKRAVSSVVYEPHQNTHTATGINLVMREVFVSSRGDRPTAQNVLIVLTDGMTTEEGASAITAASNAKTTGVTVLVIGVGSDIKVSEIKAMSSNPQKEYERYWVTSGFTNLGLSVANQVVTVTCSFKCPLGTFGDNCLSTCPVNCDVLFGCDKDTGVCSVCKSGYTGRTCDTPHNKGGSESPHSSNTALIVSVSVCVTVIAIVIAIITGIYCIIKIRTPETTFTTFTRAPRETLRRVFYSQGQSQGQQNDYTCTSEKY